jgi:hypothetical protein
MITPPATIRPTTPVPFPGRAPGNPLATSTKSTLKLENAVIGASWSFVGGRLVLTSVTNKLTRSTHFQQGTECFRISTTPPKPVDKESALVAVHILKDRVVVTASADGNAWTDLASFPRTEFPGDPSVIRIGKMNLKAEAKSHSTDGPVGTSTISEITPAPASLPNATFAITSPPHATKTESYPFPKGTTVVSARIAKGSDTGMSWAPAIAVIWEEAKRFVLVGVRDKPSNFNVVTAAGERVIGANLEPYPAFDIPASTCKLIGNPVAVNAPGTTTLSASLIGPGGITIKWSATLRAGCGYIRQRIDVQGAKQATQLTGLEFMDVHVTSPQTMGTAPGCPVVAGDLFFGVELPGCRNALSPDRVRIGFGASLPLGKSDQYSFGSVMGVAPAGQLRRAFLHYVEHERARPSKPFLHYNCWYDLGFGVDEKRLMRVIDAYNRELVKKRGVNVESYLVDDGWDDTGRGLWAEDLRKFPGGFTGLAKRMRAAGAKLAVWISPLGGYGGDRERTNFARKMGIIPPDGSLDLAHAGYKQWFLKRCTELMRTAGVNAFKWDRAGDGVSPHFMALLDIARSLRKVDPNVFINVTVGTWPSPFWLMHVDSTWRNGSADVGWLGKGSDGGKSVYNRERWLTFRDGECHRMFVRASPLYPLNSVMHHGIVHGREFQGGSIGDANPPELRNEARSYFASGAMLQELYLTPELLNGAAWDAVADAAKWAHKNADVLVDAHWVGGDPLKGDVYGYAAWNARKGTLMLRNASDVPQRYSLDIGSAFELPAGASKRYRLTSPYSDQRIQSLTCDAGTPDVIELGPFEVVVFDAMPVK